MLLTYCDIGFSYLNCAKYIVIWVELNDDSLNQNFLCFYHLIAQELHYEFCHEHTNHVPIAEPNPAQKIARSQVSTNSLSVTWHAPASGDYTSYIVSLAGSAGSETIIQKGASRSHTFGFLVAGTQYTVEIIVRAGDQQSSKVVEQFYTSKYAYHLNMVFCFHNRKKSFLDQRADAKILWKYPTQHWFSS